MDNLFLSIANGFASIFGELPEQGDGSGLIEPRAPGRDDARRHTGSRSDRISSDPHQHHDVS